MSARLLRPTAARRRPTAARRRPATGRPRPARRLPAAALVALLAASLAAPVAAQPAFQTGDLWLYNAALMGGSSSAGGIVRIDPSSGQTTLLHDLQSSSQRTGAMCWDPHRKQLIFVGDFVNNSIRLWSSDAAGNLQDLGQLGVQLAAMTARGDGLVYMHRQSGGGAFFVLDGANVLRPLYAADGVTPYEIPGFANLPIKAMQYDATTNSLFVALGVSSIGACGGGFSSGVSVRRLPLSPDGRRVVGAAACTEFEVSTSGEDVEGLSVGPGGAIMVAVDTNSNAEEPRMWQVDPATVGASVFASSGYFGAAALSAGTWSTARNAMVIFDSGNDLLRSYTPGSSGAGTEIVPSQQISSGGSSGETATLIEITDNGCDGAWRPFGAGLAGSGGITPIFTGGGCAEPGGLVQLTLDDVLGGTSGFAFAGFAQATQPFKGGVLHVFPFALSVPLGNLGGAPGAPGDGGLTVPVNLPADPGLSGVSVFLQGAFVDPGAPVGVSLTQGLEMILG